MRRRQGRHDRQYEVVLSPLSPPPVLNASFFVRLCGVCALFASAVLIGGHMLQPWLLYTPSLVAATLGTACVFLPVVSLILGRYWVRFCWQQLAGARASAFWEQFLVVQVFLAVVSFAASAAADVFSVSGDVGSMLVGVGCLISFCLVSYGTHTIGGRLRHARYRVFQPFEGGLFFCVLQGIAWTLFSLSFVLLVLHSIIRLACALGECGFGLRAPTSARSRTASSFFLGSNGVLLPATSTALAAEVLLVASLLVFQSGREAPSAVARDSTDSRILGRPQRRWWHGLVIMFFVFCAFKPEVILWSCMFLSLCVLYPDHAALINITALWVTAACVYVFLTLRGRPSITGRRVWPLFRRFARKTYDAVFEPYFQLSIVLDEKTPPDPTGTYVFGYHPHAIIPMAVQWATLTSQWTRVLPGVNPVVLASSIVHSVPITRDFCQWNGAFDVSREGFFNALRQKRAVILVPGGQEEMIGSKSHSTRVPINTKHKGFVRIALETGASLVPVYSFGETQTFDNVRAPASLQRWLIRNLRANLIAYPYGALPMLPRPQRVTIVIGAPIPTPKPDGRPVSQRLVEKYHAMYFRALLDIFNRHRSRAGRPRDILDLNPPLAPEGLALSPERKAPVVPPAGGLRVAPRRSKHVPELVLMAFVITLLYGTAVMARLVCV